MNREPRRPRPAQLVALAALPLLAACGVAESAGGRDGAARDWSVYGGAAGGDRYSELTQIDRANVASLEQAWRFDTGVGGLQTSPLVVGGTLYGAKPDQTVFALDAATGRMIWEHAPRDAIDQPVRGLTYWAGGGERRLFSSAGPFLIAVDPRTGKPAAGFGEGGRIDLRRDLGRDPASVGAVMTSPGVIFGDLIIVGFRTSETPPAAPGAVRAYDVRTGALKWSFSTIPRPGETGHDSWPAEAWKTAGGANAWAGMVVDEQRGIVFAPTGSAVEDFYGADRIGDNLFANSLVALDARTGRRLWHYQIVHHDTLDRDLASPPVLLTITRDGKRVDAVAQPTKHGYLFVLDRQTGKPLFRVEERPVPQSDVPGEKSSPTQPVPLKPAPFARQRLTPDLLTHRTPEAHAAALKTLAAMRSDGPFTPLSLKHRSVVFPGFDGGAEWGGAAVDRARGILYLNSNDIAWEGGLATLDQIANQGAELYRQQCAACHGLDREGAPPAFPRLTGIAARLDAGKIFMVIKQGKGRMPGFGHLQDGEVAQLTGYLMGADAEKREVSAPGRAGAASRYGFTGYKKLLDADGYPIVAPPWGTLNAIDLNTGEYLWKIPLGEYPELVAKGMANTGSENYGGPLVTASGLVVIGATIYDSKLRAFDSATGKLLWQTVLPFAGTASPITYMVGGRQYIVIATSNLRNAKARPGSAYVAYALPRRR
jgi:quinoprotein glucose dehydrogenase